jgi:hypothetical protein
MAIRSVAESPLTTTVLKNGQVVYRAPDGGVVSDEATAISVPQITEGAVLKRHLHLSLADERFQGKALIVEGSDEFKLQVAKLSALEGLSIRLADPVLEEHRQRHIKAKELNQEAIKQIIQEKNKQPEHDSSRVR